MTDDRIELLRKELDLLKKQLISMRKEMSYQVERIGLNIDELRAKQNFIRVD